MTRVIDYTIDLSDILTDFRLDFIGKRDAIVDRLRDSILLKDAQEDDEAEAAVDDLSVQTNPAAFAEILEELIECAEEYDGIRIITRITDGM